MLGPKDKTECCYTSVLNNFKIASVKKIYENLQFKLVLVLQDIIITTTINEKFEWMLIKYSHAIKYLVYFHVYAFDCKVLLKLT